MGGSEGGREERRVWPEEQGVGIIKPERISERSAARSQKTSAVQWAA